jgi:hypothetical protein
MEFTTCAIKNHCNQQGDKRVKKIVFLKCFVHLLEINHGSANASTIFGMSLL